VGNAVGRMAATSNIDVKSMVGGGDALRLLFGLLALARNEGSDLPGGAPTHHSPNARFAANECCRDDPAPTGSHSALPLDATTVKQSEFGTPRRSSSRPFLPPFSLFGMPTAGQWTRPSLPGLWLHKEFGDVRRESPRQTVQ
jgi:hypothetical protein